MTFAFCLDLSNNFFPYYRFMPSFLRLGSWNIVMFVSYEQIKRAVVRLQLWSLRPLEDIDGVIGVAKPGPSYHTLSCLTTKQAVYQAASASETRCYYHWSWSRPGIKLQVFHMTEALFRGRTPWMINGKILVTCAHYQKELFPMISYLFHRRYFDMSKWEQHGHEQWPQLGWIPICCSLSCTLVYCHDLHFKTTRPLV